MLALLVERAPAVVSREDLRVALWGDDVHVDVEQSLNYCIRQIRQALDDDALHPRFVETLPRQGYRFVAPVSPVALSADVADFGVVPSGGAPTTVSSTPSDQQVEARWGGNGWSAAGAVLLGLLGLLLWQGLTRTAAQGLGAVQRVVRIAPSQGDETQPAFAPDGVRVVFSSDGGEGGPYHLYVTTVGAQVPLRLTEGPAPDSFPAWSPDGKHIAFIRTIAPKTVELLVVPSAGGPARVLRQFRWVPRSGQPLAWTPDGRRIIYSKSDVGEHFTLDVLSLDTGESAPLRLAGEGAYGDASPAVSPDGQWLAFVRLTETSRGRLMVQRLGPQLALEGAPLPCPDSSTKPNSPTWSPDSRRVVYADGQRIIEWPLDGSPRTVYVSSSDVPDLSIAWRGDRVRAVASRPRSSNDIWSLPIAPGSRTPTGPPIKIVASTANDAQPRLSPDGRRLAFISRRSGFGEVWLADADGSHQRQLSHLNAMIAGYARWSPDGRRLAFHARLPDDGRAYLYVADAERGLPRRIAGGMAPSWSPDGQYLFATSGAANTSMRVRLADGSAEPLLFGDAPVATPDGSRVLYWKTTEEGIFARPLHGESTTNKEERLVGDYVGPGGGFVPVEDGVYYSGTGFDRGRTMFRFFDFATGRTHDIAPAPRQLAGGLTVSPDQRQLLFSGSYDEPRRDLVLLEFQ